MRKFLSTLWKNFENYQLRRASYWQLQHLSDSQLRDIGLSRGEIHYVLRYVRE